MTAPTNTSPRTAALSSASVQAALTLFRLNAGVEGADANVLHRELLAQIESVNDGDLQGTEARLTAQAATLDGLFHCLLRRGLQRADGPFNTIEPVLRLALKAQSQCRVTLETLAAIRNPQPVAYVGQANIGQAVQVNNTVTAPRNVQEATEKRR